MEKTINREQKTSKGFALSREYIFRISKPAFRLLFPAILICMAHSVAYAQTKPSSAKATELKMLCGTINPLNENQTFAIAFPNKKSLILCK